MFKAGKNLQPGRSLALFFIHTKHYHDLVPTHTDEFLDRTNPSPGQLGKQNHPLDVVIFELGDRGHSE